MADEMSNGRLRADVAAALAEPAIASLARAGAPVVVAEGEPPRAIHANDAALALFGVADCEALTARLFGAGEPGSRRLAMLAREARPGAAARLERIHFSGDRFQGAVTLLCRRTPGESALFVLAAIGLRAGRFFPQATAVSTPMPQIATPLTPAPQTAAPAPLTAPSATPPSAPSVAQAGIRDGLAPLRARLAGRFPGLAPVRFLWRTDSRNIVIEVTPPLAEIVGPGCAELVGRDLVEASDALGIDPRGELGEALRAKVTFSRVDVDWPIERASAAAPVTLGALPVFDHGENFEGWRGFGVIHLDRLREGRFVATPLGDAAAGSASHVETAATVEVSARRADEAPAAPEAPEIAPPTSREPAPLTFSGVVVPLRPLAQTRATTNAIPVEPSPGFGASSAGDADDDEADLVTLSPHERSAFREIALALGARGLGNGAGGSDDAESASETAQEPSERLARGFGATVAEALPVGLVVSRDGELLYANRIALDWLAFPDLAAFREAGGLRTVSRLAAADLAPGQKRALLLRGAGGEAFSADACCERLDWDGGPAEALTLIRPSALALEQRIGVVEASLRQRESEIEETQSMLDAAADGVVLVNADGAILGLDRSAEALLGYDRNQVAGENFTLLLARESHLSALDYFARARSGAEKQGREAIGRTRQGATLPLHLTVGRLGKAVGGKYCLILRDMSHWRQTERGMEAARARAERDSQAKSEFLAKVSHEIRTPLNAILGFAEVIMDERFGPVGNERYKDYLRDIHASGAHVMSLVNDLLDLSKIEAGKLDLNIAAVDANRIVSECVSIMQPQANREKVITRLALANRLPAIQADERSLRQIVLNLLANAVRYNEPGGQVIVSTALSDSGHAVLRVKDTGIGMTESELGAALEPFRQVAPTRGGTGLGLPLTKALAEANGASFSIKSRKNEGTLVEVAFPFAPGATESVSAGGATR